MILACVLFSSLAYIIETQRAVGSNTKGYSNRYKKSPTGTDIMRNYFSTNNIFMLLLSCASQMVGLTMAICDIVDWCIL